MHIAVEVKHSRSEKNIMEATKQLCGYLRQMLREQLDRRFALGFTLCYDQILVWLADRSGLFGMNKAININKVWLCILWGK